jgi:uncharacterized protein (TIGR02271 family)
MLGNQGTGGNTVGQQFAEGTPVYDVDGDEVGHVSEHGIQDNSLVLHHGLLREDVYVPLSVITRNDADGVYLAVDKDDVLNRNWDAMRADTARVPTGEMAPGTTRSATSDAILVDETGGNDDRVRVVEGRAGMNRTDATWTATDQTTMGNQGGTMNEGAGATVARAASAEATTEEHIPVREEQLVAGKRQEEIGRVHVHKDVIEEPETVTGQVTREQVEVERVPMQGQVTGADADAFQVQDFDIPVKGETLVAEKQPVEREEVRLHKQTVTEEEQVTGTVRKERVVMDGDEAQAGDTNTSGTTMRRSDG